MNRNDAPHGQLPVSQIVADRYPGSIAVADLYMIALPGAGLLGAVLAVVLSWL